MWEFGRKLKYPGAHKAHGQATLLERLREGCCRSDMTW